MKIAFALLLVLTPACALAAGPQPLGTFGDWTAASYGDGTAKACYAFTTAKSSSVTLAGRGPAMLTVTRRKSTDGDEVTLTPGYAYPKSPTVNLTVGSAVIAFYTSGQTAFTSDGAKAVAAFQAGATATARSSGPKGTPVTDNFSLNGFSGAYVAIKKACP